jgi:outer membrane murein-binding lipoprotein Lpp
MDLIRWLAVQGVAQPALPGKDPPRRKGSISISVAQLQADVDALRERVAKLEREVVRARGKEKAQADE